MARATLAAIITRVRVLIGDPAGATQQFSDDQVQAALDLYRVEQRWAPLRSVASFTASGNAQYLDFYSDSQNWEDDYLLQSINFSDITATTSLNEPIVGHWLFATQPNGFAVRITGKTYDIYASAADLLEEWAAVGVAQYAFTSDGQTFRRDQVAPARLKLAETYRKRARARAVPLVQSEADWTGDGGFGDEPNAVTYPVIREGGYA